VHEVGEHVENRGPQPHFDETVHPNEQPGEREEQSRTDKKLPARVTNNFDAHSGIHC